MVIAACNASIDIPAELAIGGIWDPRLFDFVAFRVVCVLNSAAEFGHRN
jgi:hypothetical protein